MPDLNKTPCLEIHKDEKGKYWLEYQMSDHEALGLLHAMIKRVELTIRKEERE